MKILAMVPAGGKGTGRHPTAARTKSALPLVRGYRVVDFVLGHIGNSDILPVHVPAQYKSGSLVTHIDIAWAPARG